jgi:hypothetical protein
MKMKITSIAGLLLIVSYSANAADTDHLDSVSKFSKGKITCQTLEKNFIATVVGRIEKSPTEVELIGYGVAKAVFQNFKSKSNSVVITYDFNCSENIHDKKALLELANKDFGFKVLSYQPLIDNH